MPHHLATASVAQVRFQFAPPAFRQDRSGARHQRPGLQPLFLVGDDTLSRTWLKERVDEPEASTPWAWQ